MAANTRLRSATRASDNVVTTAAPQSSTTANPKKRKTRSTARQPPNPIPASSLSAADVAHSDFDSGCPPPTPSSSVIELHSSSMPVQDSTTSVRPLSWHIMLALMIFDLLQNESQSLTGTQTASVSSPSYDFTAPLIYFAVTDWVYVVEHRC